MQYALLILFCLPAFVLAQDFQFRFEPDSIPVVINGWQLYSPWAGGVSESNPAISDIDADGDLDVFIGEYFGYLMFWKNNGDSYDPNYQFITSQYSSIYMQESRANPCFRDLDGDGDSDLVVGDIDGWVHYYCNIGTPQTPNFQWVTDTLVHAGPWGPPWCLAPELVDIDGDGDLDLFGGWQQLTFFRNDGTPQNYNFTLVTDNFAGVNVSANASVDFVDIDGDNDYELFTGDSDGRIWFYRNDGDSVNYNYTYVTNYFDSIDVGDLASPEFVDIDGDGDYDLFVGKKAISSNLIGDVFYSHSQK